MESAEQEERSAATLAEQTNTVPLLNGEPEAVVGTKQAAAVRTIPSLESIRRKLSVAGLTDEVCGQLDQAQDMTHGLFL